MAYGINIVGAAKTDVTQPLDNTTVSGNCMIIDNQAIAIANDLPILTYEYSAPFIINASATSYAFRPVSFTVNSYNALSGIINVNKDAPLSAPGQVYISINGTDVAIFTIQTCTDNGSTYDIVLVGVPPAAIAYFAKAGQTFNYSVHDVPGSPTFIADVMPSFTLLGGEDLIVSFTRKAATGKYCQLQILPKAGDAILRFTQGVNAEANIGISANVVKVGANVNTKLTANNKVSTEYIVVDGDEGRIELKNTNNNKVTLKDSNNVTYGYIDTDNIYHGTSSSILENDTFIFDSTGTILSKNKTALLGNAYIDNIKNVKFGTFDSPDPLDQYRLINTYEARKAFLPFIELRDGVSTASSISHDYTLYGNVNVSAYTAMSLEIQYRYSASAELLSDEGWTTFTTIKSPKATGTITVTGLETFTVYDIRAKIYYTNDPTDFYIISYMHDVVSTSTLPAPAAMLSFNIEGSSSGVDNYPLDANSINLATSRYVTLDAYKAVINTDDGIINTKTFNTPSVIDAFECGLTMNLIPCINISNATSTSINTTDIDFYNAVRSWIYVFATDASGNSGIFRVTSANMNTKNTLVEFTKTTPTWNVPKTLIGNISALAVGGGGGGGGGMRMDNNMSLSGCTGGGGGGRVRIVEINTGGASTLSIIIGAGGRGGTATNADLANTTRGGSGGTTIIRAGASDLMISRGGGGGGACSNNVNNAGDGGYNIDGLNGGGGGGGGWYTISNSTPSFGGAGAGAISMGGYGGWQYSSSNPEIRLIAGGGGGSGYWINTNSNGGDAVFHRYDPNPAMSSMTAGEGGYGSPVDGSGILFGGRKYYLSGGGGGGAGLCKNGLLCVATYGDGGYYGGCRGGDNQNISTGFPLGNTGGGGGGGPVGIGGITYTDPSWFRGGDGDTGLAALYFQEFVSADIVLNGSPIYGKALTGPINFIAPAFYKVYAQLDKGGIECNPALTKVGNSLVIKVAKTVIPVGQNNTNIYIQAYGMPKNSSIDQISGVCYGATTNTLVYTTNITNASITSVNIPTITNGSIQNLSGINCVVADSTLGIICTSQLLEYNTKYAGTINSSSVEFEVAPNYEKIVRNDRAGVVSIVQNTLLNIGDTIIVQSANGSAFFDIITNITTTTIDSAPCYVLTLKSTLFAVAKLAKFTGTSASVSVAPVGTPNWITPTISAVKGFRNTVKLYYNDIPTSGGPAVNIKLSVNAGWKLYAYIAYWYSLG